MPSISSISDAGTGPGSSTPPTSGQGYAGDATGATGVTGTTGGAYSQRTWPDTGGAFVPRPPFPGTEDINAAEVFGTPGYQAPQLKVDPIATIAMVCALMSFIPAVGLLAALLGSWAVRRSRRMYRGGVGMAWFGVVIGVASTVCWLWLWWGIATVYM